MAAIVDGGSGCCCCVGKALPLVTKMPYPRVQRRCLSVARAATRLKLGKPRVMVICCKVCQLNSLRMRLLHRTPRKRPTWRAHVTYTRWRAQLNLLAAMGICTEAVSRHYSQCFTVLMTSTRGLLTGTFLIARRRNAPCLAHGLTGDSRCAANGSSAGRSTGICRRSALAIQCQTFLGLAPQGSDPWLRNPKVLSLATNIQYGFAL